MGYGTHASLGDCYGKGIQGKGQCSVLYIGNPSSQSLNPIIQGANVQLGPGLGLARVPTAGRNFEYISGEDPHLGAVLGAEVVRGIQEQGVIANAKHWVNNEIEDQRQTVSSEVDERTRFELYYPPFEACVEAGVLSVMCAYNRINGVHACQNNDTLGHLKKTMKFDGWVMSDWGATHASSASLLAGMDQEMPWGVYFSESSLTKALDDKEISMSDIDDSVTRILTAMYAIGIFDEPNTGDPSAVVTSAEHNALAREIAAKSTVLLKNDNILPMALVNITTIAVIGDNVTISGGGSGHVNPSYTVSQYQGLLNAVAEAGALTEVTYLDGKDVDAAVALASKCQYTVVVVATTSSEGGDRPTLSLGDAQNTLVSRVAMSGSNVVVSVVSPGAVLLPWADEVKAILMSWLPGQEAGNGLADVLTGKVNPYGRLPVTIPNMDNEVQFTEEQYPGVGTPPSAVYSEHMLVGYR